MSNNDLALEIIYYTDWLISNKIKDWALVTELALYFLPIIITTHNISNPLIPLYTLGCLYFIYGLINDILLNDLQQVLLGVAYRFDVVYSRQQWRETILFYVWTQTQITLSLVQEYYNRPSTRNEWWAHKPPDPPKPTNQSKKVKKGIKCNII